MPVHYADIIEDTVDYGAPCPTCGLEAAFVAVHVRVIEDELGGPDVDPRTIITGVTCRTCGPT